MPIDHISEQLVSLPTRRLATGGRIGNDLHIRKLDFQWLCSYVEVIMHGLSAGSERGSTISALLYCQLRMDAAKNLSFKALHEKQSKVQNQSARDAATHQVPPSLVVLVLLYLSIRQRIHLDGSGLVFPDIPSRSKHLKDAIGEIFDLRPDSFNLVHVRKLWTTICNITLGKHQFGKIVALDQASEQHNHSAATHRDFYSTTDINWKARMFLLLHAAVGEVMPRSDTALGVKKTMSFLQLSDVQILECLRDLCGKNADFRSAQQREMLRIVCNASNKHRFFGLECDGGKSLSVLVPVAAEIKYGRSSTCRIYIVPYTFLQLSLAEAFRDHLSVTYGIHATVESYSGADIVDAAASLILNHSQRLEGWASRKLISGIYFDEIQTMVTEFNFRPVYQQLKWFASAFGTIPFTVLSGSLASNMILPVMRQLQLGYTRDEIDIVESGDLLGSGFDFFRIICRSSDSFPSRVKQCIDRSKKGNAAHVICAFKRDAHAIESHLKPFGVNLKQVDSDTPKSEQEKIANMWYHGEFDVLISTTVSLVGNENGRCKTMIIVRPLFDISSLIQVIGRLRPNQRGVGTEVIQLCEQKDLKPNKSVTENCDRSIKNLINANFVSENEVDIVLRKVYHIDGYKEWLRNEDQNCFVSIGDPANYFIDLSRLECRVL
eukprot:scaffold15776_cov69-Cylindrotheca_fusiformis.AAC.1